MQQNCLDYAAIRRSACPPVALCPAHEHHADDLAGGPDPGRLGLARARLSGITLQMYAHSQPDALVAAAETCPRAHDLRLRRDLAQCVCYRQEPRRRVAVCAAVNPAPLSLLWRAALLASRYGGVGVRQGQGACASLRGSCSAGRDGCLRGRLLGSTRRAGFCTVGIGDGRICRIRGRVRTRSAVQISPSWVPALVSQ
jgi:hypothetical protein